MELNWKDSIKKHFETVFEQLLNSYQDCQPKLYDAILYSTLNKGKRMRPLLVYATGLLFEQKNTQDFRYCLDLCACAIEMIHTYSLIHDDLPAMDNDDYRHGKLSCHKAFGEATAILTGDALLTEAFLLLSNLKINASARIQLIQLLGETSGLKGMIDGQMMDIENENQLISIDALKLMHAKKTGALIKFSVLSALLCAEVDPKKNPLYFERLTKFSYHLGLAFQIQDDILDIESSSEILGKTAGKDRQQKKSTYPILLGMDLAKQFAIEQMEKAIKALDIFSNEADELRKIAKFSVNRVY